MDQIKILEFKLIVKLFRSGRILQRSSELSKAIALGAALEAKLLNHVSSTHWLFRDDKECRTVACSTELKINQRLPIT
jgi:hypothetical protein